MTRCDYDAVFYRVFCVTLLAIAFTFTVILTNVFIDIDGLLANKKDKHNARLSDNTIPDEFTSEATENFETNYAENDDSYRTKRSIETQSFLFHIKNPKIKSILANRLTTLLEELDAEENANSKAKQKKPFKEVPKDVEIIDTNKLVEEQTKKARKDEDMLHLTMHNIILQGIIGHMDLNDVYKRVHHMMENFNEAQGKKEKLRINPNEISKISKDSKALRNSVEKNFFEELVNCNELQNQISDNTKLSKDKSQVSRTVNTVKANPNVVIKTVIDIKSLGNDKDKENDAKNTKENIQGVIELIYNGKLIKFTRPDVETIPTPQRKKTQEIQKPTPTSNPVTVNTVIPIINTAKINNDVNKIPKSYLNKFVEEYFKHFPYKQDKQVREETKENIDTKRLKRHIKVKYDEEASSIKPKKKSDEDELYVEIETHFDSKGLKGEKKKKLIRSLIEKIQKAIHSDMNGKLISKKNKRHKQIHFTKREQNPLENKNHVLVNKYSVPLSGIIHRQLNPISKTVPMQESSPYIGGRSGEDWKKPCSGPGFLTATKSINSAELSEVDVNYSKVLDVNGVPQRLQKPLNAELSEETVNTNSYYDIGDMKFFIKDIDGSGFSVGFNQYVDEPPDQDTMKLFTGLENVIKTYHQTYDPADQTTLTNLNIEENNHDAPSTNTDQRDHVIARRSVNKKQDYHSNEYKIIFDDHFLPYDNYRDIFETKKKTNVEISSKNRMREMPLIVDENILDRNLKPSEIFGLANLFERKKRSINVKKISNLKSKIKLNRYLNTKAMSTKRIFLNKKRNKRQINKIRIIATDLPHLSKHSDENFFVVSDENVFADRAIVKDVDTSEMEHDKREESEYIPYQAEDNPPPTYVTKIFDGRSRHNSLMSKYPHIFMEEISRSREEYIPDNSLLFGKIPGLGKLTQNVNVDKDDDKIAVEQKSSPPIIPNVTELPKLQKEQDIMSALGGSPKANYKVTVKIVPKNNTGLNSGFKEIHTSINKRFNKNGLLYSSLVNVSEISKVVKLNRSKDDENRGADSNIAKRIKDQQEKMQILLKEHAKHITEQLNRLNEEKTNLESILIDEDNNTDIFHVDYEEMDVKLPSKESNKIVADTHKEVPPAITMQTAPTTTTVLTTTPPPPIFSETLKSNIIKTIERNGNLTDQILKKIDKNTEILQVFLRKLTDRIEETTTVSVKEDNKAKKFDIHSLPPAWTNSGIQFNQNMVIRKNDSHVSIPFVYAYQQPMLPLKRDTPVASVVYHGHIHTNTIHTVDHASAEKDKLNTVHKIPDTNNQTRFFIDELENDYKVIQVGDVKKSRDHNMVNGTMS